MAFLLHLSGAPVKWLFCRQIGNLRIVIRLWELSKTHSLLSCQSPIHCLTLLACIFSRAGKGSLSFASPDGKQVPLLFLQFIFV